MKHLFTLLLCAWAMQCIGQKDTTTKFFFSRTPHSWGGDTPYQYSPNMHLCGRRAPDFVSRYIDSTQAAKIARYSKLRKAVEDIQSWQFIIRYCQRQIDSIKNSLQ